ncbi:hypothetical protein K458DRAFT_390500 [Lentithecium fluviatile CBS 122367]|uniref:Uncharacterized protein n=1 Tax=Lentithecium fluviatile CBS 122367 TaxID=1168545 RepID=A0A6G1IWF0_9PLEO|nr:hypothetical protein K458DRAFT_390500 [Lentithecium fluviatile CBS 122367]
MIGSLKRPAAEDTSSNPPKPLKLADQCPASSLNVITVRNQLQSPLLRLHAELRNSICVYALGGLNIYIL